MAHNRRLALAAILVGLTTAADLLYHRALQSYVQYRKQGRDRDILDRAKKDASRAVDLYGKWLEKRPDDKAAENRQLEVNMILYSIKGKYVTLQPE